MKPIPGKEAPNALTRWKQAYYPVPANEVPEADALEHSLIKWQGLRKSVLDEYGLKVDEGVLSDSNSDVDNEFSIDSSSCALCQHYLNRGCEGCPLFEIRGQARCDYWTDEETDEDRRPPYGEFTDQGNPEPMIRLLEQAVDEQKEGETL